MEMVLQIAGVVVPCFAALGGLFAWGVRRMDRRFEEARQDRVRIEAKLDERCSRIEEQFDERCSAIEAKFDERCSGIEAKFDERCSRIEERIDRLAEQLSDETSRLNRELGRLQGIVGGAKVLGVVSG